MTVEENGVREEEEEDFVHFKDPKLRLYSTLPNKRNGMITLRKKTLIKVFGLFLASENYFD